MNETRDKGGQIYPHNGEYTLGDQYAGEGINRRDWLAGLAMQGILSSPTHSDDCTASIVSAAYSLADAMIAEGKR
jgi:hypothetical protein